MTSPLKTEARTCFVFSACQRAQLRGILIVTALISILCGIVACGGYAGCPSPNGVADDDLPVSSGGGCQTGTSGEMSAVGLVGPGATAIFMFNLGGCGAWGDPTPGQGAVPSFPVPEWDPMNHRRGLSAPLRMTAL